MALPSAAPSRVGELPPCLSQTVFDGRVASMWSRDACGHEGDVAFYVSAGPHDGLFTPVGHPETRAHGNASSSEQWPGTDDPDEARAAYERAQEWVRTGELPDA